MYISKQTAYWVIYWNAAAAVLLIAMAVVGIIRRHHYIDALFVEQGRAHLLDPRLVASVAWRESRFKPNAVSSKGAIGLMQVSEMVGKEWAAASGRKSFVKNDLFNPAINIQAGSWMLQRCLSNWDEERDPLPYALASYVAGLSHARRWANTAPGHVKKFVENITFPSAQRYVEDILTRYRGDV